MTSSAADASRSLTAELESSPDIVGVIAKPTRRAFFLAHLREYYSPRVMWVWILLAAFFGGAVAYAFSGRAALQMFFFWAVPTSIGMPAVLATTTCFTRRARRASRFGEALVVRGAEFGLLTEQGKFRMPLKKLGRFRVTKTGYVLGSIFSGLFLIARRDFKSPHVEERFVAALRRQLS